jgi:hypothetical protein
MRNWHHRIIKLDKARNIIVNYNQSHNTTIDAFGSNDICVGIIESGYLIEFKSVITNNNPELSISQYKASHPCFEDINNSRKVIFRKQSDINKAVYTENILINKVGEFFRSPS